MSHKCSSVLAMNEHTKPRKQNLFEVGFSLVSKLLKPFIKKKPRKGLGSEILPKIELVLREKSWDQALIPVCYQYLLLNQKKNVCVKYVYQKYQVQE